MTPEEEKVIAAAQIYREMTRAGQQGGPYANRLFGVSPSTLFDAVDALDASRAPKPPMTKADAEWELRAFGGEGLRPLAGQSWMSKGDFLLAARDLESAAWDRAIERAAGLCELIYQASYVASAGDARHPSLDIRNLLGKCHEAAP